MIELLSYGLLVATLLPLWRHPHWCVRGFDFPRAQFALLAAIILMLLQVDQQLSPDKQLTLSVICLVCFIWQLWWILPYTFIWPKEVKTAQQANNAPQISIITANVLASNRNAEALLSLVDEYQPDILVTLESDHWWQSQLDKLEAQMPHSLKCPQDNLYGMHVYSRLPLEQAEIKFLVEADVPSMHCLVNLAKDTTDEIKVRLHFLHPAPPSPTENAESKERDAELILVAKSTQDCQQPIIVTGDLNDVAWSPTTRLFRKISGLLDPRVGRGIFNTFHAKIPLVRWPLDHLFHSHHFQLKQIKRLPKIGSDHFALFTQLVYAPAPEQKTAGLEPEPEDKSWANEITQEQNLSSNDVPLSKGS